MKVRRAAAESERRRRWRCNEERCAARPPCDLPGRFRLAKRKRSFLLSLLRVLGLTVQPPHTTATTGAAALALLLREPSCPLERLLLTFNSISDEGGENAALGWKLSGVSCPFDSRFLSGRMRSHQQHAVSSTPFSRRQHASFCLLRCCLLRTQPAAPTVGFDCLPPRFHLLIPPRRRRSCRGARSECWRFPPPCAEPAGKPSRQRRRRCFQRHSHRAGRCAQRRRRRRRCCWRGRGAYESWTCL